MKLLAALLTVVFAQSVGANEVPLAVKQKKVYEKISPLALGQFTANKIVIERAESTMPFERRLDDIILDYQSGEQMLRLTCTLLTTEDDFGADVAQYSMQFQDCMIRNKNGGPSRNLALSSTEWSAPRYKKPTP